MIGIKCYSGVLMRGRSIKEENGVDGRQRHSGS
jgi:hypothetical protein